MRLMRSWRLKKPDAQPINRLREKENIFVTVINMFEIYRKPQKSSLENTTIALHPLVFHSFSQCVRNLRSNIISFFDVQALQLAIGAEDNATREAIHESAGLTPFDSERSDSCFCYDGLGNRYEVPFSRVFAASETD